MNFLKYALTGQFKFYAAIACMVAIVVMLLFYMAGELRLALYTFCALAALLKVGITGQLFRWLRYRKLQKRFDKYYDLEKRYN